MTKSKPPKTMPRPAFGNTLPAGEVNELGEETGWAAWHDAVDKSEHQFAHTAPMTVPALPGVDPRYAKTAPAPLPTDRDGSKAALRDRRLSADNVMVEARKNNRVCPRQRRWAEMFGLLGQWAPEAADLPAPPLTGESWRRAPALTKRMAFRDHVEWAEQHDCLAQLLEFLGGLPEHEWHHMGD